MTPEQIQELMTGRKPRKPIKLADGTTRKPKNYAYALDADSVLTLLKSKDWKVGDVGSFTGKTGSVRRNRKGRTYKLPNGSRRYQHWNENITAYKVTPS
jgi:hypothetical protein